MIIENPLGMLAIPGCIPTRPCGTPSRWKPHPLRIGIPLEHRWTLKRWIVSLPHLLRECIS
jgi:hypothetical protein